MRTSLKGCRCTVRSLHGQTVNASFALQYKAILTKQARVCSPAGIRVSKTEWTAQNRWMRYNSSSLAHSAGKPCLLDSYPKSAANSLCASPNARRALTESLQIYHTASVKRSRSRIHDLHPDCAFLENFSQCFNAVWLRITVPLLMQMFSESPLSAL